MSDTTIRQAGTVTCDDCDKPHVAEYDHNGRKDWDDADTRYFSVICDVDSLTGYYAESRVDFTATPTAPTAATLGLELTR